MKTIAVLGSTGSIGKSTLQVALHLKDQIKVKALAAHSNIELLEQQIAQFQPEIVGVFDEKKALELKKKYPHLRVVAGAAGLEEIASYSGIEFVVVAIVGLAALAPTLKAIESGKSIGLANKEVLVSAGDVVMQLARQKGVSLIPIDSEHSGVFQCLEGHQTKHMQRVVLTASGGPFRTMSQEQLKTVNLDQALAHPTWKMGPKITVDSSTLMNKGFEIIEAHYLFGISPDKLEVVIHPQSIIHCLIEFVDGCMLAQMSDPHMIYPIQYALTYPERKKGYFPPFDFIKNAKLEFFTPDFKKFRALGFAFDALKTGGSFPCYLNAANEVLVDRFLKKEISWLGITERLDKLLNAHAKKRCETKEAVFEIDQQARKEAALV